MSDTDIALLGQWIEHRDAEAFRTVALKHAGAVFGTCRRILGNATEAEDVAQECFEFLARAESGPKVHLGAWLQRVATTRSLVRLRSEKRRRAREERFAAERAASGEVTWDGLYSHVDEAIAELPDEIRAAIVCHFLEGQTHEEAARGMGVSRQTVTYRIGKGLDAVRTSLEKKGVRVTAASLGAAMTAHMAEAAPASLALSLGKLALAGPGVPAAAAAGSGASFLGGVLSVKGLAALGTVALVFVGAWFAGGGKLRGSGQGEGGAGDGIVPVADVASTGDGGEATAETAGETHSAEQAALEKRAAAALDEYFGDTSDGPAVCGVVLDPSGQPARMIESISGRNGAPRVDIVHEGASCGSSVREDGSFAIRDVPPGKKCQIWARRDADELISALVEVDVPKRGVDGIVLRLKPGASVSGRVIDKTGKPLVEHYVSFGSHGKIGHFSKSAKTDTLGRFRLAGLPPGKFTLSSGLLSQNYVRKDMELSQGQHVTGMELAFPYQALSIAGQVLDGAGRPLQQEELLSIREHGDWEAGGHVRTDDTGRFKTLVGGAGQYDIEFGNTTITVEAGDTNVRLVTGTEQKKAVWTISGNVVSAETGAPLSPVTTRIRVQRDDQITIGPPRTSDNSDGRFSMEFTQSDRSPTPGYLARSQWTLIAEAPGYAPAEVPLGPRRPGQSIADLTARLEKAVPFRGRLVDPDGKPVAGADIFDGTGPSRLLSGQGLTQTDSDGMFTHSCLGAGSENFSVKAEGFPLQTFTAPAASERDTVQDITLSRGAVLEGVVTLAGKPLEDVKIRLSLDLKHWAAYSSLPFLYATTGKDGVYRFTGLPAGTGYVVMDVKERHLQKDVAIPETGTTRVDLPLGGGNAVVRGRVYVAGKPVENYNACLSYRDGDTFQSRTAHPWKGEYRFEDAPAGPVDVSVFLHGSHTRQVKTCLALEDGRETVHDFHLSAADAVIEGRIDGWGVAPKEMDVSIEVETETGTESLSLHNQPIENGTYRIDKVPVGTARMRVLLQFPLVQRFPEDRMNSITRHYEVATESAQATVQDIAPGPGRILTQVSGLGSGDRGILLVLEGDDILPDPDLATFNDVEQMVQVLVRNLHPSFTQVDATGLEPGGYTVLAVVFSKEDLHKGENTPLADLRYGIAAVKVEGATPVEVNLVVP